MSSPASNRILSLIPLVVLVFALFSGLVFWSTPAQAQRFVGPVATAMGGAGRAASDPLESFFLNPASLAFLEPYLHFGGHFQNGDHPRDGQERVYGAGFADATKDKFVPGAFSFLRGHLKSPSGVEAVEQEYRATFGGFVRPGVALGLGAHYREHQIRSGPGYFQTNLDLGTMVAPISPLAVSFVAYNVLSTEKKVPEGIRDVPALALGFHGIYEEAFRARLDFVRRDRLNPDRRIDIQAGIETVFMTGLALRLGCHWNESENKTLLATGVGFKGPKLQVDYTLEQDLRVDGASRHLIDLWLPF